MIALFSNKFQLTALLLAIALVAGALFMRPRVESVANGATTTEISDEEGGGDTAVPVGIIEPKHDPGFKICVTQPAYVEAYYRVELRARVAGPVLSVTKAMGDQIKTGEELIKISVPDLAMDVAKKEAIVEQRRRELEIAEAFSVRMAADLKFAAADIKEKEADVSEAEATASFRKQELARFEGLAREDKAITANIVEERRKFYEAAVAASARARATVEKAQAAEKSAKAKLQEAKADEKLKSSLILVAEKDRDLARELMGFGTLRAPWDGGVAPRTVAPGRFVQNSASSPGPALLSLERTELVTVYSNIPDNFAPYVDEKTEAIIEMSELPGVLIRGVVTRFSRSLQNPSNDRTMRVDMD